MSFTRDYSIATPIDHTLNSLWPTNDRNIKQDVQDRLATIISGFTSGETVLGVLNLPFIAQGSDPSTVTDQIQLYAKAVAGKTELFTKDEDGNVNQITSAGKLNVVNLTGNQSIDGIKTFTSSPIVPAPTTDLQVATKKYVDDEDALGSWQSKSFGTTYQAATDGFVVGYGEKDASATQIIGYSDSSSSPTTIRQYSQAYAAGANTSICFPVKKNDYYLVTASSVTNGGLFFIALGT